MESNKIKKSKISWFGNVPFDWEKYRIKYLFEIGRGRVISILDMKDEGKYPVFSSQTLNNGIMGYVDTYDFDGEYLTWTTDGVYAGTIFKRKGKFNCTNICGTLKVKDNRKINIDFAKYSLEYVTEYCKRPDTNGAKIMNNEMAAIKIYLPNLNEQHKIADFLDSKCQKIDDTIEKINKQIEVLKKYKQSLITEVVTKGLDKNVEMKESGVEWIGKICSNWKIGKIGYYYEIKLGKMVDSNIYDDNEMCNYLCAANIKWGGVDVSVNKKMKFTKEEQTQYLLKDGDVIITEGGSVGTACIYHDEFLPCYIQNSVHRCRGKNGNVTKFLYYWMNAVDYLEYILSICNKATIMHYTEEKLKKTPIVVMPIVMQQKIVDYLDDKCSKIDSIINKKSKQIDILERYKKSLIYEYVTGKKKVK